MSIEQYQRTVNVLDKDIADLEKKKAALDKKAAEEQRKAANCNLHRPAATEAQPQRPPCPVRTAT